MRLSVDLGLREETSSLQLQLITLVRHHICLEYQQYLPTQGPPFQLTILMQYLHLSRSDFGGFRGMLALA